MPARPDVAQPLRPPHPRSRPLPVRRVHASRWQRHGHQRAQRRRWPSTTTSRRHAVRPEAGLGAAPTRPRRGADRGPGGRVPAAVMIVVYLAALGTFTAVVALRGGPSVGDAYGVTKPATAIADGDLSAAAHDSILPQPPGYALLTSPLVLVFRPLIGASEWCDGSVPPVTRLFLPWCKPAQLAGHKWYRSQGVLGILAWIVFADGLPAAPAGGGSRRRARRGAPGDGVAAIPAASDAVVETFHPQDLVCVGLCAAGLAEALRRRWVATGVLFGVALMCKQFALLPLVAVLAAAPRWGARGRVVLPALAVVACGVIPFAAVDPTGTWNTLRAVNASGVVKLSTGTVVGMTNLSESTKLVVARDGPVVMAVVMALWARWRAGPRLLSPVPLIGLATACLAARLVAEVWFASYYLLAVSAGLLLLDLASRRLPVASFVWIAVTGVLVEQAGGLPTTSTAAWEAFVVSVLAIAIALRAIPGRTRPVGARPPVGPRPPVPGPGRPVHNAPTTPRWRCASCAGPERRKTRKRAAAGSVADRFRRTRRNLGGHGRTSVLAVARRRPGHRHRARGRLPSRLPGRGLGGRRRLLRPVGVPHHLAASVRAGALGPGPAAGLLGPPRPPPAPRPAPAARGAGRLRAGGRTGGGAVTVALPRRGHTALLRQLAADRRRPQLLRPVPSREPAHAHLVPGRRGAVLPRLAAAVPRARLARPPSLRRALVTATAGWRVPRRCGWDLPPTSSAPTVPTWAPTRGCGSSSSGGSGPWRCGRSSRRAPCATGAGGARRALRCRGGGGRPGLRGRAAGMDVGRRAGRRGRLHPGGGGGIGPPRRGRRRCGPRRGAAALAGAHQLLALPLALAGHRLDHHAEHRPLGRGAPLLSAHRHGGRRRGELRPRRAAPAPGRLEPALAPGPGAGGRRRRGCGGVPRHRSARRGRRGAGCASPHRRGWCGPRLASPSRPGASSRPPIPCGRGPSETA